MKNESFDFFHRSVQRVEFVSASRSLFIEGRCVKMSCNLSLRNNLSMLHFTTFVLYFSSISFRIDEALENSNLMMMGNTSIQKETVVLQNITILSKF